MKLSNRISTLTGADGDGWDLFFKARAIRAAGQPVSALTTR